MVHSLTYSALAQSSLLVGDIERQVEHSTLTADAIPPRTDIPCPKFDSTLNLIMEDQNIYEKMEYGPAPESAAPALDWLAQHQQAVRSFVDGGAGTSPEVWHSVNSINRRQLKCAWPPPLRRLRRC